MERTQPGAGDAEQGLITRCRGVVRLCRMLLQARKAAFIPAIAAKPALRALGVKKA